MSTSTVCLRASIIKTEEPMRVTDPDAEVAEITAVLRKFIYAPERAITARTLLADLGLELEAVIGHELPNNAMFVTRTVSDLAACFSGRWLSPPLSLVA
jgi:hypothetical protein